jgi:pilus assembly protein Flp/PilA
MTKILNLAKRMAADEDGAAMIEYGVLIGIVTVALIATISLLGGAVNTQLRTACNTVKNAAC